MKEFIVRFPSATKKFFFFQKCVGFETKIKVKRILSFTENVLVVQSSLESLRRFCCTFLWQIRRRFSEVTVRMNERVVCVPKPIHFGFELYVCMLFFFSLLSIVHSVSFDDVALLHLHLFKVQNPLNQRLPLCIIIGKEFGVSVCIKSCILCGIRNTSGVL